MTKIELEDGKYTVTYNKGELKALRYGEPWREMIGDKLMYAMFCRIQELESDAAINVRGGFRRVGQTTSQMKAAPAYSVFVWVNHDLYYPRRLAELIGRTDLEIVGPSWLTDQLIGRRPSGLVIDHAAYRVLTGQQMQTANEILSKVISK